MCKLLRSLFSKRNGAMGDDDSDKVLVYHYRGDGSVLKDNFGQVSQSKLEEILKDNPTLQATTKRIEDSERDSHGEASIQILQKDLYTDAQKEMYKSKSFNYESNIASVDVKKRVAREFSELTILSRKKD